MTYNDEPTTLQRNLVRAVYIAQVADHWRWTLPDADGSRLGAILRGVASGVRDRADSLATGLMAAGGVPDARPATVAALGLVHFVPEGQRSPEQIAQNGSRFLEAVSGWLVHDATALREMDSAPVADAVDELRSVVDDAVAALAAL